MFDEIQFIQHMGCTDSRSPATSNANNPVNQTDSKINESNLKASKKLMTPQQVEIKRTELHSSMIEGNSKPPVINLPRLPNLEFGGNLEDNTANEYAIYNEIVPGSQEPGFSPIYRQRGIRNLLKTPNQNMKSVADILHQCKNKFGNRRGLGEIIVTVEKGINGESIQKRSVKEYTYNEIYDTAYNLGKALAHRNLAATENLQHMKILGIYSKNRLEWFLTDWACTLFGYVLAPLYDSLGKENLSHCIDLTGTTTLFVSQQTAKELVKFHQKGTLKTLILFDKISQELQSQLRQAKLELLYFRELIEQGKTLPGPKQKVIPRAEDVYSFCFTSGTTGPPKASMILHSNMMGALVPFIFHNDIGFNMSDVHLSYLPLPHMMERAVIYALFYEGAFVVVSSGNILKIREDAAAAQVTTFLSVPRIYNRIADGVRSSLAEMVKNQAQRPQIQKAVFQKVRQSFGGKLRIIFTGSAPMNPAVQQLMQKVLQCPMIQGYGQTESTCGILFSRKTKTRFGVMHEISAGVQIRLADIPEMRYTSKDKDSQGRPTPRGEICVRGPQVFAGYYKRKDLTKEVLSADGWLRTGDVGEITPDLGFKIIDRKKNIFKLQQGEYVAPDRVEACYMRSELLQEIFLHGNSYQNFPIAIATPLKDKLMQIAENYGQEGSFAELCKKKVVRAAFLTELNAYGKRQGLMGYQLAKNIYFQTEGFAVRKILTNTQKLIRFEAKTYYAKEIQAMYAEGELKI